MPLKAAAQYVGGLVLAACFVVLLSFTFSFLGTIFCAALAGMMLGALRTHKWQAIPVSLLFPLVIFTLLKGMRTELGQRQILAVALACLSVFWLTYGLAAALFFYERKGPPPAGRSAPAASASGARLEGDSAPHTAAIREAGAPKHNGWLSLEMLQGNWSGEAGAHPQSQSRRLSIEREKLTLSVLDSSGQVRIVAQAQVKLCALGSPQTLELSEPSGGEASPRRPRC